MVDTTRLKPLAGPRPDSAPPNPSLTTVSGRRKRFVRRPFKTGAYPVQVPSVTRFVIAGEVVHVIVRNAIAKCNDRLAACAHRYVGVPGQWTEQRLVSFINDHRVDRVIAHGCIGKRRGKRRCEVRERLSSIQRKSNSTRPRHPRRRARRPQG
jgi:hypothetical protein